MITITEKAVGKIKEFMLEEDNVGKILRVYVEGGGCLLPNGKITLINGSQVAISDIKVGDKVLDMFGCPSNVTALHTRQYDSDIITLIPRMSAKYNAITTTSEHPILVIPREKMLRKYSNYYKFMDLDIDDAVFTPAMNVRKDDIILYIANSTILDSDELDNGMCRFLGYYLAEGCINSKIKRNKIHARVIELYFHKNETDFVDDIIDILASRGIKTSTKIRNNVYCVKVYNTRLAEFVLKHCGTSSKKYNTEKFISQSILELPTNKQVEFMLGYWRGDGDAKKSQYVYRISTTIDNVTFSVQQIMARIGWFCSISFGRPAGTCVIEGRLCNKKQSYKINWYPNPRTARNIINHSGKLMCYGIPVDIINNSHYTGTVQNISTTSETFCTNGIITHNCAGFQYGLAFDNKNDSDTVISAGDIEVLIDQMSSMYLSGAEVDYVDGLQGAGFRIINPNAKSSCGCGHSFSA